MPKASSWMRRLTGFSTPWFGASWQPTPSERDVARELLAQFEDRRVLYNPSDVEIFDHCVHSVIEIRHLLTNALIKVGRDGPLAEHIRALGAASRKFLDSVGNRADADFAALRSPGHYKQWEFLDALGQLRGVFGVHIALIAARFDLKVHGDLQNVLPAEPASEDFGPLDGRARKLRRGPRRAGDWDDFFDAPGTDLGERD